MDANEKARVTVVLVRARNPSNIGAVARAMHDFGFSDLRVVNEFPVPFQAAKSAVDASSVMQGAREFTSLAEALADCTFVLGTTAVGERVVQHPLMVLNEGSRRVRAEVAAGARVALMFGSEKTGLSNDEMSHCTALLTIPMSGDGLSMNLGQAAAVCLYQVALGDNAGVAGVEQEGATAGELERMTGLLVEVLEASGYARRHPANARETTVRRLVRRMGASGGDAQVWTGVLRQVLRAVRAVRGERGERQSD